MLIRTFRRNTPATPVLLFLAGLALWSDAFLYFKNLLPVGQHAEPLSRLLLGAVEGHALLNVLGAFLLMLIQAFMLNTMVQSVNLLGKPSWLPALLYVALMSSDPSMLSLNPVLCANFFLLLALGRALASYGDGEAMREVFNVGLLIALAGLFYYPALAFFFWLILVLATYFLLSIRGFIAATMGFLTPFFFMFTWYYLTDQLGQNVQYLLAFGSALEIAAQSFSLFSIIMMLFLALLSFIALMRLTLVYITDKPVRIRKRFRVLVLFFVFSLASAFAGNVHFDVHHSLMMIPLSVAVAVLFVETRRKWIPELVFYLLLGLIVAGKVLNFV